MQHENKTLREWMHALDGLGMAISGSDERHEADLIRLFHDLVCHSPTPTLVLGLATPSTARLESLLDLEATDSAVLSFIGPDMGFCLSRGSEGDHLASVILPHRQEETTAAGATMALACLCALTQALANASPALRADKSDILTQSSSLLH
jgi:hypothetical protein